MKGKFQVGDMVLPSVTASKAMKNRFGNVPRKITQISSWPIDDSNSRKIYDVKGIINENFYSHQLRKATSHK